jgi:hypothetical protein
MTDEKRKILPSNGCFFVVADAGEWPENAPPRHKPWEWCPAIEADTPEEAVEIWARETDKTGGFSGDPYPDRDEMLVRDSDGAEWKVYLSTDWQPSFIAHSKEAADAGENG